MFQLIERLRLGIKQKAEVMKLQRQKERELRELKQNKQFEINKTDLEREIELEELKAEVRKQQQKSLPKPGQQIQKKTAFAAFQNYCDNFAKQPSIIGELKIGGVNGKKNNKGSRKRNEH